MHLKDAVVTKNQEALYRIIDGKAVVVPLKKKQAIKEKVIVLNETATRVWELIDGSRSVTDIVLQITREFDIDAARASSKVNAFILNLEKNNLIIKYKRS